MKTRITILILVLLLAVCDQATPQRSPYLTVVRTTPLPGATGVPLQSRVAIEFSAPVASLSVSFSPDFNCNSKIQPPDGTIRYCDAVFSANTIYTITIKSATGTDGRTLAAPFSWTFSTARPTPLTKPDLRLDPNSVGRCTYTNCMFQIAVTNAGQQAAGPFQVQVFYDNGNAYQLAVDGLAASSFKVLSFPTPWNCLEYDFGVGISVDATNAVVETNESNNTETWYCDLK